MKAKIYTEEVEGADSLAKDPAQMSSQLHHQPTTVRDSEQMCPAVPPTLWAPLTQGGQLLPL